MNSKKINIIELAKKLQTYPSITKFDSNNEKEAWRIAHSLKDIQESSSAIFDLLPKLETANSEKEAYETLLDIGEEFRHIMYHIRDPGFFKYLLDDKL